MSDALADTRIARGMRAQLAARRARLDAGDRPLGWKVGFGAPAIMARFGIAAPLVGHLLHSGRIESGGMASLAGGAKPVAEPEIAVHIGRDVGPGDNAAAAIVGLGAAIELADLDPPPEDIKAILAGNIYQRHVVVGPMRPGAGIAGLTGHVIRNGAEVARTDDVEANTGKLVDLVRHVADLLAACGERLRAGEIIIGGSVVPPLFVTPDDTEIALVLDPIGEVSVQFSR